MINNTKQIIQNKQLNRSTILQIKIERSTGEVTKQAIARSAPKGRRGGYPPSLWTTACRPRCRRTADWRTCAQRSSSSPSVAASHWQSHFRRSHNYPETVSLPPPLTRARRGDSPAAGRASQGPSPALPCKSGPFMARARLGSRPPGRDFGGRGLFKPAAAEECARARITPFSPAGFLFIRARSRGTESIAERRGCMGWSLIGIETFGRINLFCRACEVLLAFSIN